MLQKIPLKNAATELSGMLNSNSATAEVLEQGRGWESLRTTVQGRDRGQVEHQRSYRERLPRTGAPHNTQPAGCLDSHVARLTIRAQDLALVPLALGRIPCSCSAVLNPCLGLMRYTCRQHDHSWDVCTLCKAGLEIGCSCRISLSWVAIAVQIILRS
jgi:hypothetical protein